jgi:integrase
MAKRRRPGGEGSVYQRSDGKWEVRLWVGSRRLQRTVSTQREALALRDQLKAQAQSGLTPSNVTVGEVLDDFMDHGERIRDWAPATTRSYESAIRLHIRPALGRRKLAALKVPDVQRWVNSLTEAGHSARHVAHVRGVLRSAVGHAQRMELVERNVGALVTVPRQRRPEFNVLSASQVRDLLATLEGHRLQGLFATAVMLGLRRGELIALRWSDVNLDIRSLDVRRTGARIGGEYVEGPPKSARSRRTIAIPRVLVDELRRHRARIHAERLRLGPDWIDEDRAFPNESGGPLGATTIRKTLNGATDRADLPHLRVHDCRHIAASMLIAVGGSLSAVQELLGHATQSLTADLYAHLLDEQRQGTADLIDRAMGG